MPDWSLLRVSKNQFPKHKKYSGHLLIVGGGRCVWDDLEKVPSWDDVMCINDIIMHFPRKITHAYSNDWKMLPRWIAARRPRYRMAFGENIIEHTGWPWKSGNSGLSACYTGIALGYDKITLIGMPLDDNGHYFEQPGLKTKFTREAPDEPWIFAKQIFQGKVKSLSGRTKLILGD